MAGTADSPEPDDTTTLAKVNDDPAAPDEPEAAADEKEDDVTVLAKMNDNPPREDEQPR